ncbi:hypothetical protein P7C73_g3558, partial [Tremellales sp. Uapishka_1]
MIQSLQQVLSTTWSAVGAAVSVILVLLYGYGGRKIKLVTQAGEDVSKRDDLSPVLAVLGNRSSGVVEQYQGILDHHRLLSPLPAVLVCLWSGGRVRIEDAAMDHPMYGLQQRDIATAAIASIAWKVRDAEPASAERRHHRCRAIQRESVHADQRADLFTFGPYMMTSHSGTWTHSESPHSIVEKLDAALPSATSRPAQATPTAYPAVEPYPDVHESSPLIRKTAEEARQGWRLAKVAQKAVSGFMNPPMIGGLAAIIAGVIPFLHKWLFAENAWLSPFSQSIENLGALYAVLQTFVLGAHLKSKKGSKPPLWPLLYLFTYRFFIMPLISISVVYSTRKWLGGKILLDPVLDFVMAISAVGPPALTLAAIVEMSDADESTHTAVAQTIVISYVLTPLISVSVTAALTMIGKLYD